jgi:hypothetical protein
LGPPQYFKKTKDRKVAYSDLLKSWENTTNELQSNDAFRPPLLCVATPPGMGKTRFVYAVASGGQITGHDVLDGDWCKALAEVKDEEFRAAIHNSVGVTVTFNHKTGPRSSEPKDSSLVGVRMLFSHFVRDHRNYDDFLRLFNGGRPTPAEALAAIRLDVDANHTLSGGGRRHIILVVDELLAATLEDLVVLADITTGLGEIIDANHDVHVVVTSLSKSALDRTLGPSKRATRYVIMNPFTESSVADLISTLSDAVQAGLATKVFRAVVRECVGIPRLLEVVCKSVLKSGAAPTLQGVRALLAADELVVAKHVDRESRNNAVLCMFSAWRFKEPVHSEVALTKFRELVDVLAKSGYLYRISATAAPLWQQAGVPPLLLRAWDIAYSGDSDPLLQAAVKFLSNDDVVGAYDGRRDFEPQAEALIEILWRTQRTWRHAEREHLPALTIRSLLGGDKTDFVAAVTSTARFTPKASFNLELADDENLVLEKLGGGVTEGFDTLQPYTLFHFDSTGTDAVLRLPLKSTDEVKNADELKHLLVFFQWKFSDPNSAAAYTHYTSLAKTLRGRSELIAAFKEGRLCFVMLGMRTSLRLNKTQFRNIVDEVAKVEELKNVSRKKLERLVANSLVMIGKEHAKALAGPTLAGLVQFEAQNEP